MEEEIFRKTDELVEIIRNSEEYLKYHKNLSIIKQDGELYNRVNELRRRNFEIQNGDIPRLGYTEYDELSNLSNELRKNPVISEFLDSEIGLARMIQEIQRRLMSGIEFDGEFLD